MKKTQVVAKFSKKKKLSGHGISRVFYFLITFLFSASCHHRAVLSYLSTTFLSLSVAFHGRYFSEWQICRAVASLVTFQISTAVASTEWPSTQPFRVGRRRGRGEWATTSLLNGYMRLQVDEPTAVSLFYLSSALVSIYRAPITTA